MNDFSAETKISLKILMIKPDAVYQDKTYTQDTIVQFTDGQKIEVFDKMMLCKHDTIGDSKKGTLEMLTLFLERSTIKEIKIFPDLNSPIQEFNCRIETVIPKITTDTVQTWINTVVDIGPGKMVIDVNLEKYPDLNLEKGDFVHVKGRVDLISIE